MRYLKTFPPVLFLVAALSGCPMRRLYDQAGPDIVSGPAAVPSIVLDSHPGRVVHVEFEPLSNRLVSLSEDGVDRSTIIFWHGGTGAMADSFTNTDNADCDVEFSRDGKTIGIGGRTLFILDAGNYRIVRTFQPEAYEYLRIIDLEFGGFTWPFGTKRYTVETRYRRVTAVSFSPDIRYVASGHENGQLKIWEIKTGDLLNVLWATRVFGRIMDVEFSPDGRYIAACQDDERIRAWRFPDYQEHLLTGHERAVYSIDFDPVTGHLVSAGAGGRVLVWEVETGKILGRIDAHEKAILSVSVSEDGKTLFTGSKDNSIGIWDLRTGRSIFHLYGHEKQVNSVAVNSNATLLASGSDDGTVRIWDISTMRLCDNIALTPQPIYPARLNGMVWFEEDSGDGVLEPGETGRFVLEISNEGAGTAFNIVTLAIPDSLYDGVSAEPPGLIPMLLPGKSVVRNVTIVNNGKKTVEGMVFTFRVLESNGFHINPPLRAATGRRKTR
jgi:WD40 repeat protein